MARAPSHLASPEFGVASRLASQEFSLSTMPLQGGEEDENCQLLNRAVAIFRRNSKTNNYYTIVLLPKYVQGQTTYILRRGIAIMKQRKLNRKKITFVIVIALIFLLPLIAIGKTVVQRTYSVHTRITQNTQTDMNRTAQPGIPPGSDWSMYLHDPQRTAATDERVLSTTNVGQLSKLWTFKTGGTIAASAAVVSGTVYVGSWDGYEYALDQMTGKLKWKTFLGITKPRPVCNPPEAGVTSSAAIQDGVLYVGG